MSLQARYADLLAFVEERDRQLMLPMGEDCGRQSGQFAPGNTCAAGDDGSQTDSPPRSRPDPVAGGPRSNTSNGFPGWWNRDRPLTHRGGLPGLPDIGSIKADNAKEVTTLAKDAGFQSLASLVRFGAADGKNSEIDILTEIESTRRSGEVVSAKTITIESKVPVYVGGRPSPGQRPVGHAGLDVAIRKYGDEPPLALYGLFDFDSGVSSAIAREKASSQHGESAIERTLGAAIIDKMITSLAEAEKAGASKAKTFAAGSDSDATYKGYRLWGRFGFDVALSPARLSRIIEDSKGLPEPALSPEYEAKALRGDAVTLQDLLSTKAGEKYWSKNGSGLSLTLDFTDKNSAGYKRYQKMLERVKKAKDRGQRSYEEFCEFALATSHDLADWRGFRFESLECRYASLLAFAQSRNCGTGEGGFQKGNTCAGGKLADAAAGAASGAIKGVVIAAGATGPFPPYVIKGAAVGAAVGAVKGLYDNSMQPTRVMQKIDDIGTSEKQVAGLVERLGGSPESVATVKEGKLRVRVKDSKGEKVFDVEMGKSQYTITPARKSGTLTSDEIAQVKKIAEENSPKEVSIVVKSKSPSYVAKLVRKGFKVTANAAGSFVATVVLPLSASVAVAAAEGVVDSLKKKKR
jgi:hypothetical protein